MENLRTSGVPSGKPVDQTRQLKNGAKPTKAWTSKNSLKEYTTGGMSYGPLGGKNARK